MFDVRTDINFYAICIFVNELLHAHLCRRAYVGFQAYIDGEAYRIDIWTTTGNRTLEYDSRDKWEKILNALNAGLA